MRTYFVNTQQRLFQFVFSSRTPQFTYIKGIPSARFCKFLLKLPSGPLPSPPRPRDPPPQCLAIALPPHHPPWPETTWCRGEGLEGVLPTVALRVAYGGSRGLRTTSVGVATPPRPPHTLPTGTGAHVQLPYFRLSICMFMLTYVRSGSRPCNALKERQQIESP